MLFHVTYQTSLYFIVVDFVQTISVQLLFYESDMLLRTVKKVWNTEHHCGFHVCFHEYYHGHNMFICFILVYVFGRYN